MIEEKIKCNEKYKTLTPKPPSEILQFIPKGNGKALDLGQGCFMLKITKKRKSKNITALQFLTKILR
jgi:hypothetical protein